MEHSELRQRTMSQSSTERDLASEVKAERKGSDNSLSGDARPNNPKKRPSTGGDSVDYPRRRATIAVRTLIPAPTLDF